MMRDEESLEIVRDQSWHDGLRQVICRIFIKGGFGGALVTTDAKAADKLLLQNRFGLIECVGGQVTLTAKGRGMAARFTS